MSHALTAKIVKRAAFVFVFYYGLLQPISAVLAKERARKCIHICIF